MYLQFYSSSVAYPWIVGSKNSPIVYPPANFDLVFGHLNISNFDHMHGYERKIKEFS